MLLKILWVGLKRYWRVLFAIGGAFAVWLLLRRSTGATDLPVRIAEIDAQSEAERLQVEEGKAIALVRVRAVYQNTKAELTEAQQNEAKRLAHDPVGLARFLVRAGSEREGRAVTLSDLSNL